MYSCMDEDECMMSLICPLFLDCVQAEMDDYYDTEEDEWPPT